GALFAKALARHVKVDYRLLVASAYSGFSVWHGGLAGSVPLTIATPGHFKEQDMGILGTGDTIFAAFNLLIVLALFIIVPLVNRLILPSDKDSVYVDPELLKEGEAPAASTGAGSPAVKMENSRVLSWLIGGAGVAFLFDYLVVRG